MNDRIRQIRESEKLSHVKMYSDTSLYETEMWLGKPIKAVRDVLPIFADYDALSVLDLGCGIGRNCICIAREYQHIRCKIDALDILELAVKKLKDNAVKYNVQQCIRGVVGTIEDYTIIPDTYDLILAISALEHVESEECLIAILREIHDGVRNNGAVCLIMNTNIREKNQHTGETAQPQFEINMTSDRMKTILREIFAGWQILKQTEREQRYDIPRDFGISELQTNVVTLVARKKNSFIDSSL